MPQFRRLANIWILPMVVCSLAISCKNHKTPQIFGGIYFMTEGQTSINLQAYSVSRKVLCDMAAQKMRVKSTYRLIVPVGSNSLSSDWMIEEYLISDSLFIYDLADSTLLALSMADAAYLGQDALPYSSAWLFPDNRPKMATSGLQKDTLYVAGLPCRKLESQNRTLWIHGHQPLACQSGSKLNPCIEKAVYYMPDTLLTDECFRQPAGFMRLRPMNQ